jgi:hypothetical protein
VWEFFLSWLRALKGPDRDQAFSMIDHFFGQAEPPSYAEFAAFLAECNPETVYTVEEIDLDDRWGLDCCESDSSVSPMYDGGFIGYIASLYLPIRGDSVVLRAYFFHSSERRFQVWFDLNEGSMVI